MPSAKTSSTAREVDDFWAFSLRLEHRALADTRSRPESRIRFVTAATLVRPEVPSENSSKGHARQKEIQEKSEGLFRNGNNEWFEDGMESSFSRGLVSLVLRHGDAALVEFADLIVYERVNPSIAGEALRWLGRMDHPATYRYRRWLLERSLGCSSSLVRDGAVLGLASMDDPHAILYLKQAIDREKCADLRKDMLQTLKELESSPQCHTS